MKFSGHVIINQPQKMVAELFANPEYLGEYQEGFVRKELLSGEQGQNGAISQMYFEDGKRKMELTETIVNNNLPESFESHYHHIHMDNTMKVSFVPLSENQTRYEYEFEYTRINWVMPRLMAILFPGVYRKQGERWMQNFKEFVERQPAGGGQSGTEAT